VGEGVAVGFNGGEMGVAVAVGDAVTVGVGVEVSVGVSVGVGVSVKKRGIRSRTRGHPITISTMRLIVTRRTIYSG